MDRDLIEREVRRLSPWYYRFDLDGVRTDITPPCDHHGHRSVSLPPAAARYLTGKTVLDVACNEGAYSFSALDNGARHVVGFDCRPINIEKAKFVASVKGYRDVEFSVASCDSWLAVPRPRYDFVFLCGLLYHLPEPWATIEDYARLSRSGIFVTCVLHGGADGYSPFPEQENIAASERPSELSMMPNTTRTLVREFSKRGFAPIYIGENRTGAYWGGCSLVLRRVPASQIWSDAAKGDRASDIDLHLVPDDGICDEGNGDLSIVLYNWSESELEGSGHLSVVGADGQSHLEFDEPIHLPRRVASPDDSPSESVSVRLPLDLSALKMPIKLEARLVDLASRRELASTSLELSPHLSE